jgi:hypothetical protein
LFCEADYSRCERYKLRITGAPVPATLMPNGKDINDIPGFKKSK